MGVALTIAASGIFGGFIGYNLAKPVEANDLLVFDGNRKILQLENKIGRFGRSVLIESHEGSHFYNEPEGELHCNYTFERCTNFGLK